MTALAFDLSLPVSVIEIYTPGRSYFIDGESTPFLATPGFCFGAEDTARYLKFADEVSPTWTIEQARRKTPRLFRPDGIQFECIPVDQVGVARESYRSIAVPQFQGQMLSRSVGLRAPGGEVLRRWWQRRLAEQRGLDLAMLLRDVRSSYRWLRRNVGALESRRFSRSSPMFDRERQARLDGRPTDDRPQQEWTRLSEAVLRLVAFDPHYSERRFADYSVRFASRTDMGGDFLERYGRAISKMGIDSGKPKLRAVRWLLALRAWRIYADSLATDWTWGRMRLFQRNVIWNFELIEAGHPPEKGSPETIAKWLDRNGW